MRKLKLKEVGQRNQGHTFNKRQRVTSDPSQIQIALNLSLTTIHTDFLLTSGNDKNGAKLQSHYYTDCPYLSILLAVFS